MDSVLFVFAVPCVLWFALAAARVVALQRYRSLLDPLEPSPEPDDEVRGIVSGRRAGVGFAPSDFRKRPGFLQIWTSCATSFRWDARRVSLATRARRLVGAIRDEPIGIDEVDRRFYFDSDDPGRLRALADRPDFVAALTALADLGVDDIRLEDGFLSARKRQTWIVPIGGDTAREMLKSLSALALAIESTPVARAHVAPDVVAREFPELRVATQLEEPGPPPAGAGPRRPLFGALVFLSLWIGGLIVGSFWEPEGYLVTTGPERWALVYEKLPAAAVLAGMGAFLAHLLVKRNAVGTALLIGWPVLLNGLLVWGGYLFVRDALPGLAPDPKGEIAASLAAHEATIRSALTTVTSAMAAVLGSALVGAWIGGIRRASAETTRRADGPSRTAMERRGMRR